MNNSIEIIRLFIQQILAKVYRVRHAGLKARNIKISTVAGIKGTQELAG